MDELEGCELEATRLEPADDAADKPALDAVGLGDTAMESDRRTSSDARGDVHGEQDAP